MSIKIENLSYTYAPGSAYEIHALKNLNLEIEEGQFVGIIGHTGSGKSTLIQLLDGLIKADEGHIYYNGEDIYAPGYSLRSLRGKVGLVFQYPEYQLFEETVYRDIAFGPKNMGLSEAEIDKRVREAAGFVGITQRQLQVSPFDLSGGQKRRVAIAGVIAMEPRCIVLDEPTAMLDPRGRREVIDTIGRLNREKGITVVLITHHMDEAAKAQRVVVLDKGKVAADGTPKEVFSQVELLHGIGLAAPETVELCWELNQEGYDLPLDKLDPKECAQALYDMVMA